jgi:hypothetical protein
VFVSQSEGDKPNKITIYLLYTSGRMFRQQKYQFNTLLLFASWNADGCYRFYRTILNFGAHLKPVVDA